jgi:hypothetical protein
MELWDLRLGDEDLFQSLKHLPAELTMLRLRNVSILMSRSRVLRRNVATVDDEDPALTGLLHFAFGMLI